jgi:hypothetical protein
MSENEKNVLTKASTLPAPSESEIETAPELAETGESHAAVPSLLGVKEEPPTLRDRMRIHSQTPELDSIFVSTLDFPGTVVKAGSFYERSFAFGRECRIAGLRLPKGFSVVRLILRVGPRFKALPESCPPGEYSCYGGEDCRIYVGDQIKEGDWKKQRLAPELQGSLYILVRNDSGDDLKFEGTILLQADKVPEPEHQEL